jgi:hypothetical protein
LSLAKTGSGGPYLSTVLEILSSIALKADPGIANRHPNQRLGRIAPRRRKHMVSP